MNALSMELMRKVVEEYDLTDGKTVIDVGSYDVNGTYRPLFTSSRYVGADIRPGPNVDVIVDSPEWHALKGADAIVTGSTFEHVEDAPKLMEQMYEVLAPGGVLCVQVPSCGPKHDYPNWYRNYSAGDMASLMEMAGFTVLHTEIDPHPEFMFCTAIARKYVP